MSKRYRLLKNWPDAEIGDIYQFNGQGYSNQTRTATVISKSYVEYFPIFFELIPEPLPLQPNRYRLLRDLPCASAGCWLSYDVDKECYRVDNSFMYVFPRGIVEGDYTWFKLEEAPPPSQTKEFQWTDELVVDFVHWSTTSAPTFQGRYTDMEQFKEMVQSKSSHTSTEQTKERIVVGSTFSGEPSEWGWKYGFTLSAAMPKGAFKKIIPAIEQVLNDDGLTELAHLLLPLSDENQKLKLKIQQMERKVNDDKVGEGFVWTDEQVRKVLEHYEYWRGHRDMNFDLAIKNIKTQSLQSSSPAEGKQETEQEKFWAGEIKKCIESPHYYYTHYLTINGKRATTRLTEEEFNKEFLSAAPDWQKKEQPPVKDWEVVAYSRNGFINDLQNILFKKEEAGWRTFDFRLPELHESIFREMDVVGTIHSVRRNSDGCVFGVGDSVCLNWYPAFNVKQPIERFEIKDNAMMIHYTTERVNGGVYELKYAAINPHHKK